MLSSLLKKLVPRSRIDIDSIIVHPSIAAPIIPKQLLYSCWTDRSQSLKPTVQVGESVTAGQLIATDWQNEHCLHAALSGRVSSIEEHPILHPKRFTAPTVFIEVDIEASTDSSNESNSKQDPPPKFPMPLEQLTEWLGLSLCKQTQHEHTQHKQTQKEWLNRIRQAGVIGMGGGGFVAFRKLEAASQSSRLHTLLVNACECEPIISCDNQLLLQQSESVVQSALITQKLLQAKRCILVIEDDKPEAIQNLQSILDDYRQYDPELTIHLKVVASEYPSGHERQLVDAVDGIIVNAQRSIIELGYTVFNVATIVAMGEAIVRQQPLIKRITTFSDGCQVINVPVYIGTSDY